MSTLARPYSPYNTGLEVPQGRFRSVQLYNVQYLRVNVNCVDKRSEATKYLTGEQQRALV